MSDLDGLPTIDTCRLCGVTWRGQHREADCIYYLQQGIASLRAQLATASAQSDEYRDELQNAVDRLKSSDHVIREMQARERNMALELSEMSVTMARVSGAICDAADVVVEPYEGAIRTLTDQRNRARNLIRSVAGVLDSARFPLKWIIDHAHRANEYDRPYAVEATRGLVAARDMLRAAISLPPSDPPPLTGKEFLDAVHTAIPDAFSDFDDALTDAELPPSEPKP